MNLRYGYNWFVRGTDTNPGNHGFDLTSLGFPAAYNAAIPDDIRRFPRFDITGYQGTGFGGEYRPNENQLVPGDAEQVARDALAPHRPGVPPLPRDLGVLRQQSDRPVQLRRDLDARSARQLAAAPGSLGQSFASFLLGLPSSGSVARPRATTRRRRPTASTCRTTGGSGSRLTLNLGLRYELETPLVEADNRSVRGFDAAAVQPMEAAARAALNTAATGVPLDQFHVRGGLTFAGVNGEPSGLYETPKNNWMPRLGATYKLDEKTVLRGGYGMFYGFLGQRRGDVITSGFSSTTDLAPRSTTA